LFDPSSSIRLARLCASADQAFDRGATLTTEDLERMTTQPKPGFARAGFPDTPRAAQAHAPHAIADAEGAPSAASSLDNLPAYVQFKRQAAELARLGIANPYFRGHEGISSNTVSIEGREYINYSGYN
jgi:hypothetical protein